PLDITGQRQNAAWAKTRFLFGAGKKNGLDGMVNAIDVVGHEYTHAVIQTSSNLKYEGQSGALNEHLADVFGAIININYNNPSNPYLIGSSILHGEYAAKAEALRDMMDPAKGLSPQPAHMKELESAPFNKFAAGCVATGENDRCGVHILSGIPNRMSALVISVIGAEKSAKLFYNVMTQRLSENSNFADYRVALMEECKSISKETCEIVDDALSNVGM
nr:M4 family metallopeptidase [Bdellovibrionales bacterium]